MVNFFKKNILLIIAIAYVLLPIDAIPDAIPLLGSLDDTALLVVDLIRRYVQYRKQKESLPTE